MASWLDSKDLYAYLTMNSDFFRHYLDDEGYDNISFTPKNLRVFKFNNTGKLYIFLKNHYPKEYMSQINEAKGIDNIRAKFFQNTQLQIDSYTTLTSEDPLFKFIIDKILNPLLPIKSAQTHISPPSVEKVHEEETNPTSKESDDIFLPAVFEGKASLVSHLKAERDRKFIEQIKRIAFDKDPTLRCEACGFSFAEKYPELADKPFIEAHHLVKLSEGERITTRDQIALLCSNCHSMIHMAGHNISLEDFKKLIKI